MTSTQYCSHGLSERHKLGWDLNAEGYEVCRGCGLVTVQSVQMVQAGERNETFEQYESRMNRLFNSPNRLGPRPERGSKPVLIVTTNDVPGYRIEAVHGDVFGLIVRARNYFSNLGASMRTLVGGEVGGYTKLLVESRKEARERLMDEARLLGANAVVAMRFDCNEIGDVMSEIAAYGTAVTIVKNEPAT